MLQKLETKNLQMANLWHLILQYSFETYSAIYIFLYTTQNPLLLFIISRRRVVEKIFY